jgi:hypothetical protein
MYYPSKELKNDNSNGINLHPILPTFIRDARYQGDARYAKMVLLIGNAFTL